MQIQTVHDDTGLAKVTLRPATAESAHLPEAEMVLSHLLRTPFSAIKWYTELLLDESADTLSAEQRQCLHYIEQSQLQLAATIKQFIDESAHATASAGQV